MVWQFFRKTTKWLMFSLHVAATLLLLLACFGHLWLDESSWLMGCLNMTVFYFWLLQLFFFVFWLFTKPVFSLIPIAVLVLVWQPMKPVFQWRLDDGFHFPKERSTLRIMTWNVEHFAIRKYKTNPQIKEEMIQLVRNYSPDVACFQEMVASDDKPQAINYLPTMQRQLGFRYAYFVFEKVLDFDKDHHFGMVIFSKQPFIQQEKLGHSKKGQNGLFQYVDIAALGDTFRFFNIHLQSLKFSRNNRAYIENPSLDEKQDIYESKTILHKLKIGFEKRRHQADLVQQAMLKSPHPMVLCGDFNDLPNSYAYRTVRGNLVDAFTELGSGIGNTYSGVMPTLRIDHIFHDPLLETTQYYRHKKKMSDHYPVIVDVRKRKQH
jgi:endonuclease/exonuclease/phosphatase family metal-dependent hydrolase